MIEQQPSFCQRRRMTGYVPWLARARSVMVLAADRSYFNKSVACDRL
jgi:hypothetical protein